MSDNNEMTFDELTSIYRVESKTASISEVRKDLYPALSELSGRIRREYETELSKDPGSIMCEGINERRKKIDLYAHKTVDQRMDKICSLALGGAMGADNSTDHLTPEERDYYHSVLELSKRHRALIGRKAAAKGTALNVSAVSKDEPAIIIRDVSSADAPARGPVHGAESILKTEPEPVQEDAEESEAADDVPESSTERADGDAAENDPEEGSVLIRILEDLPVFSGPDMDYSLRKEDMIKMPAVMAYALISREKAVRVEFKA